MTILHSVSVPDPSPTLRVTVDVEPPQLTVALDGEIDLACADLLRAITEVDMAGITTVVIDLARLEFTDTSGLRALMAVRDLHRRDDRVVVFANPCPLVRRVFQLVGFGDCLPAA
jgi:anti-anti-sigma factor